MSKLGSDVLLGVALILVGLSALYALHGVDSGPTATSDAISSSTLPSIYAALLAALSTLMVINSIVRRVHQRSMPQTDNRGTAAFPWRHAGRAGGTLALLVVYVLALSRVPFSVATAVFLAATMLLYGRRPVWRVALLSLVAAGVFHWLFIELVKLPI